MLCACLTPTRHVNEYSVCIVNACLCLFASKDNKGNYFITRWMIIVFDTNWWVLCIEYLCIGAVTVAATGHVVWHAVANCRQKDRIWKKNSWETTITSSIVGIWTRSHETTGACIYHFSFLIFHTFHSSNFSSFFFLFFLISPHPHFGCLV